MEIKVNIPKNTYVQPTEVRPEAVQLICEAFLESHIYSTFCPSRTYSFGPTVYVSKKTNKNRRAGFYDESHATDRKIQVLRINGEEMKAAFEALQQAGYHMMVKYEYGKYKCYKCFRKPYEQGWEPVTEFTDFID